VRNQLPPEAEAPIINLQTSDSSSPPRTSASPRASSINQITDYLTRVVQPKLSAISGVQRAEIFGDRTFAMRVWLNRRRWPPRHLASMAHDALAANNYLSASGRTRSMTSVKPRRQHELQTVDEFKQLV